ncbi:MAG: methylated-DNA--[protein]-cysteine S-methyltransferase [Anaerolineales bacterium]|nr:methylated-DNA--[protein]-cysteine S-methyltransferase [Chloroflexota bacterium]MBL6980852.1 methylated-DNA--[protein]-cysteine S-methyltransferase [Anaerolineales bacterium]
MTSEIIYIGSTNPTPIGVIWVAVGEDGLIRVSMSDDKKSLIEELENRYRVNVIVDEQRTETYTRQIEAYLRGERENFDLPIDWSVMTPFQMKALKATYEIPSGETRTYGEIAAQVGNPKAARAVGRAEATNPIPIVIPCHRVLNSAGKLHGYSGHGGLETKAWLLELEAQA